MPISTSNAPSRRSRIISIRSSVSISRMHIADPQPCSCRYSVRSSAMRLVRVVTRRAHTRRRHRRTSPRQIVDLGFDGTDQCIGSIRPVGRTTCSTNTPPVRSISHGPGVADTNTVCGRMASHSSNFRGRLSTHDGSRKPKSASVDLRAKSPLYMPPICGTVTWLSSTIRMRFPACIRTGSAADRPDCGP